MRFTHTYRRIALPISSFNKTQRHVFARRRTTTITSSTASRPFSLLCCRNATTKPAPIDVDYNYLNNPTYRSGVPRVRPMDDLVNAKEGEVVWSPQKSMFNFAMTAGTAYGLCTYGLDLESAALFFGTSGLSVLFGHSLGMHRKFIHNSFSCPKWLEYATVHLGTMMGIAGPLGMMRAHDLRDWAQRQPPGQCHPFFSQHAPAWKDWVQQAHCEVKLKHPPLFVLEKNVANDRVYALMEQTWTLQQLPYAALFYAIGGLKWVCFGICMRVFASVSGHFVVGWAAHNAFPGHNEKTWVVEGADVQGYNFTTPMLGRSGEVVAAVLTAGENYHNNHHAFPGSARLAHSPGEIDIGYLTLRMMQQVGLVYDIKLPEDLPKRPELVGPPQPTGP